MISRRQFCKAVGAGAITACLPESSMAWSDPSPFRATPNPRSEHFTVEDARRCVERWTADDPAYTQCLELTRYKTASIDALKELASREWMLADFGLASLTTEVARAIAEIQIGGMFFYHVENASSQVIADLMSASEFGIWFGEVESLNARGIASLRNLISPMTPSKEICVAGNFSLNAACAAAFASVPTDTQLGRAML